MKTLASPKPAVGAKLPLIRQRYVQHALTIAAALFISRQLGVIGDIPPIALVLIPPSVLVLYLFLNHPKWCLMALVATTCFGLYRYGIRIGPLTIRGNDVPLFFLIPWALLLRRRERISVRNVLGQQYIGLFMAAVAFTLVLNLVRHPTDVDRLVVAFLRLLSTVALVWILPYILRNAHDVLFALRGVALLVSAEVVWAFIRQPHLDPAQRLSGSNGPNSEGLLGGLLILMAIHSPAPSGRITRVFMFGLGAACLYTSSSIGALSAVAVTLGLFGWRRYKEVGMRRSAALLRPAQAIVLVVGLVALVSMLRPQDLPSSEYFHRSSAGDRLLLGVAGIKIFRDNPLIGVGWQRSSRPDVIATRELTEELREQFPGFHEDFFPKVGVTAVTVHNSYIQILAETGVLGSAAFIVAAIAVGRRVRRTLSDAEGELGETARVASILVVTTLIWLNDNPLFGAQPETVLLATMLGIVAAVAAMQRRRESASLVG